MLNKSEDGDLSHYKGDILMPMRDMALSWQKGKKRKKITNDWEEWERRRREKKPPLLYSLLQCCHSHRCILRMPEQSELEEVEQRKEEGGETFTALPLSCCVKVGHQTHTNSLSFAPLWHTQRCTQCPSFPNMLTSTSSMCVLGSSTWWGEVGLLRNLAFLQGNVETSREAKANMVCLTWIASCLWDVHKSNQACQHTAWEYLTK